MKIFVSWTVVAVLALTMGYMRFDERSDAEFRTQRPAWSPCPGAAELQCTAYRVPVDHAQPLGRTMSVWLARIPAKDQARRLGSLVINFGGPGVSGISWLAANPTAFATLNERYDIVTFDPRGVENSTNVDCGAWGEHSAFEKVDQTPETAEEQAALIKALEADAAGCAQRMGWLIPYVSTIATARDLDILRSVLVEEKLNYLGYSYGGGLGIAYSRLYPRQVGRLVLDSPAITAVMVSDSDIQVGAMNDAINAFVADCVTYSDCPLGRNAGTAVDRLQRFVERLDRHPLPVKDGILTDGVAVTAISSYLYSTDSWPSLRADLAIALRGHGQNLYDAAQPGTTDAFRAIACADSTERPTVDQARQSAELQSVVSPIFGPWLGWGELGCQGWKSSGAEQWWMDRSPRETAPILVVANKNDPITPWAGSSQTTTWMKGSRLVTVAGTQHTAYGSGDPCVTRTVEDYLLKDVVPDGDVTC